MQRDDLVNFYVEDYSLDMDGYEVAKQGTRKMYEFLSNFLNSDTELKTP